MLGAWRVGVLFEPAGEAPGGDRFALSSAPSGALAFYLADATGHGQKGAQFWQDFDSLFLEPWRRFASEPTEHTLVEFARELNDTLHRERPHRGGAPSSSQLCLVAGWLSRQGMLVFANFGLGIHVVPATTEGPCMPSEASFGLRLGWVSSHEWPRYEKALVVQRISGVRRLWLASDAFFGDDHWDPEAAFRLVRELGRNIADLTIEDALSHVNRLPHSGDDATFVILEPAGAES